MMSPRISFSDDLQSHAHQIGAYYRDAPVSSDFEISVPNYSMISADELFSKGRMLPLKESKTTTLRDELLQNEDEPGFASRPPPKSPAAATRWRGFLGLRKSHIGFNKSEKQLIDKRTPNFHHDGDHLQMQCTKNSQDFVDG